MKQLHKIKPLFLIILVFTLFSCKDTKEKHIGEWQGTDKGEVGSLILDEANNAIFVIGNQVIGGDNFTLPDGTKAECKYEIDYSKDPVWLDIVFYEKDVIEEKGRLKGIVRFITDNKIEYRISYNGSRYDSFDFDETEDTLVLEKITN